jgi:ABC-2 type transport system permease protein
MTAFFRIVRGVFKIGLQDSLAYRGETLIWLVSTTMPVVMFLLWGTAAGGKSLAGMDEASFKAYFLAAFLVRQLAGCWFAYQINMEIKDGTLALRLLRPVNPLFHYLVEQVAQLPLRALFSLPIVLSVYFYEASIHAPPLLSSLLLFPISIVLGYLLSFFLNVIFGSLAFRMEQSLKIVDIWAALFFVFSGYMIPQALFPRWAQTLFLYLPFRYQMGLCIEILTGTLRGMRAVEGIAFQACMVVSAGLLASFMFRRGLRRFEAYGG